MRHTWTENDDIIALYLHLWGCSRLGVSQHEIAMAQGLKPNSLRLRIANFASLTSGGSMDHTAELTRRVFARFGSLPEAELWLRAQRALQASAQEI